MESLFSFILNYDYEKEKNCRTSDEGEKYVASQVATNNVT